MKKINFASKAKVQKQEKIVQGILLSLGIISVLVTIGIIFSLIGETIGFFKEVSIVEFLFGKQWTPLFDDAHFGVLPLVSGTLLIVIFAALISIPIGLGAAIYLSEYAPAKVRKIVKPILEILAGVPSIVYGYFAVTVITPILKGIFPDISVFNALSAGIAVGIMTIPMVSSLSEDAMMAVPNSLRQGAYGIGSTKFEVAVKIVIPASISSIAASFILAVSRAIGETMIVAMAAGSSPKLTLNPLESIQTMTGFIAQVSMGDVPYGSISHKTLYAVGTLLFIITLILNIISKKIVKKYRRVL